MAPLLVDQLTAPVRFTQAARGLVEEGVKVFVEVGPSNVLAGLVKRIDRTAKAISVNNLAGLQKLARELDIAARVTFAPGVPPAELPDWYRRCAVHVNLTPTGFGDKVAWEAMACGRPCLVANDDVVETLGRHADELLFREAV